MQDATVRRSLIQRPFAPDAVTRLVDAGLRPLLARLYAARGIRSADELATRLEDLEPVTSLLHADAMAAWLADAIVAGRRLLIVGDYDADGATASAVGYLALSRFGARVETLVPNRFEYGYGLTPEIVRIAAERRPDVIVTVDNGIASHEGVAEAKRLGIDVLVTDHHLPGATLPEAAVIVNPNQPGCPFRSKHLAGVGVMFYVMVALRAELRRRGTFGTSEAPNLAELLDLVALGTVADVVRLDRNNRILVAQGLKRMRAGRARPGIDALARAARRPLANATCEDIGFTLGPRLNAAGRLDDMSQGIECLITTDAHRADELAGQLDRLNRERRGIEADMQEAAVAALSRVSVGDSYSLVLHEGDWHPGVVGLLASRLRERYHRPTFCFAAGTNGELKGSGRSVPALHLRDALDRLDRRHPGLMIRFGGHAAAAGLGLRVESFEAFRDAFEATARELLTPADLEQVIETDGPLDAAAMTLDAAEALRDQVWGQGFAPPLFSDEFRVESQRIVGGSHLRLSVRPASAGGRSPAYAAMLFRRSEPIADRILAAYRLDVNEWNGERTVQLVLNHWEPV
ncbi:MAG: single-stranded-DNA-specific exonuclease RecJ [Burkholderiales bacterium]